MKSWTLLGWILSLAVFILFTQATTCYPRDNIQTLKFEFRNEFQSSLACQPLISTYGSGLCVERHSPANQSDAVTLFALAESGRMTQKYINL